MPAGIIQTGEQIVKENSKTNSTNNAQEDISLNNFLECIEVILEYIVSQKKKKSKGKIHFMNYQGVIIEESLEDKKVLEKVKILSTRVENVTEKHQTPWLKKWTLHKVEIPENKAEEIANEIRKKLENKHTSWYADFKNDSTHYIIFRDKIFKIDRTSKEQYAKATKYGTSLGIPSYQVDFAPNVKKWER